jgi:hypothetical protein
MRKNKNPASLRSDRVADLLRNRWPIRIGTRGRFHRNIQLYPIRLRRISFRDEDRKRTLVFLTNNFDIPSETISALYKARWEIELFFKWIKQHLRVKTFYGTSANAVKTQIWVAMIVYLLLAILKERYRLEQTLSQLLHFLEVNIFEQKSMLSIFQMNSRSTQKVEIDDKQLRLFDL